MALPKLTPPPAVVYLVNRSTLISDADAAKIATACDLQLTRDVCPAWGLTAMHVEFISGRGALAPAGQPWMELVDSLDVEGAAGYHTEDRGLVHGYAAAKPALDNHADMLLGPWSVASIASHEFVEIAIDRHCEQWADTGQGWEIARECADPVQDGVYRIGDVTVSNFVGPDYFDVQARRGTPLDFLGALRRPFSMTRGGYYVRRNLGADQGHDVFGEIVPEWVKAMKLANPHSRTRHRIENRLRAC